MNATQTMQEPIGPVVIPPVPYKSADSADYLRRLEEAERKAERSREILAARAEAIKARIRLISARAEMLESLANEAEARLKVIRAMVVRERAAQESEGKPL